MTAEGGGSGAARAVDTGDEAKERRPEDDGGSPSPTVGDEEDKEEGKKRKEKRKNRKGRKKKKKRKKKCKKKFKNGKTRSRERGRRRSLHLLFSASAAVACLVSAFCTLCLVFAISIHVPDFKKT